MTKRTADELEDDHHRTFYFIEPKPCKVKSTPFVPLNNGKESQQDVGERFRQYDGLITNIMARVEQIISDSNNAVFDDLSRFIEFKPKCPPGQNPLIKTTKRMPVGYLSLTSNTVNNTRVLDEFYSMAKAEGARLITINHKSGSSTIKTIIRNMAKSMQDPSESTQMRNREFYNLDFIKQWHQKNPHKQMIIVFEETDSIDTQVFNRLLKNIHSNTCQLPVKLILGINSANTTHWIENHIFYEFRLLFDNYMFQTSNNKQNFFKILQEIVINQGIMIDDQSMSIILNRFHNNNRSIDALINELKLLLMIYFYSNSYARFFLQPVQLKDVEVLRRLPSFKRYIERELYECKLGDGSKEDIQKLITDDKMVLDKFNEVRQQFVQFQDVMKELSSSLDTEDMFNMYSVIIQGNYSDLKQTVIPQSLQSIKQLNFSKKSLFHEVFLVSIEPTADANSKVVENYSNLMLDLLRPQVRGTLGDNMVSSEPYLNISDTEPMITKLFNLLVEAPATLNHYEFYMAFRHSLNKAKVIKSLRAQIAPQDQELIKILDECLEGDKEWDKMAFAWFLQLCHELLAMGFIKEKPRGDHFEKNFWRGL